MRNTILVLFFTVLSTGLFAQSNSAISFSGTTWDVEITVGPEAEKPVVLSTAFVFNKDGTFNTVSGDNDGMPDKWEWKGDTLTLDMKGPSLGGIFTGKLVSADTVKGTVESNYGIFLGIKNALNTNSIEFEMKKKEK
jgi:hypothetical protein